MHKQGKNVIFKFHTVIGCCDIQLNINDIMCKVRGIYSNSFKESA